MDTIEFDHTLQVENQFEQVQEDVISEIAHPHTPIALTSPITLSSAGVPPFGAPTVSTVSIVPSSSNRAYFNYSLSTAQFDGPTVFPSGNLCVLVACTNALSNTAYTYNWQGTASVLSITNITGVNDYVNVNVTGNNNRIVFPEGGATEAATNFYLVGNGNTLYYNVSGTSTAANTLWVYGLSNSVHIGKPTASHVKLIVNFVGESSTSEDCPYLNATSNSLSTPTTTGTGETIFVTWENNGEYGAFHSSVSAPTGWKEVQNYTPETQSPLACAWETGTTQSFQPYVGSGLKIAIANRYYPAATVGFQEGAVVATWPSNASTMLGGPEFTVTQTANGPVVNLTLVQFVVQNFTQETGSGTIGVQTELLSLYNDTLSASTTTGGTLDLPVYLAVATTAPEAWQSWALNYPSITPNGAFIYGTSSFPHGCATIEGTEVCNVVVPIFAYSVTLQIATIGVTIT